MPKFHATDIVWDTDGEKVDLPNDVIIEAEDEDAVVDALSDEYGWCIESCSVNPAE